MRSKRFLALVIFALLILMGGCTSCNVRNTLVEQEENVKAQWANVESVYQRRADLIPNLVRTVERAEDFDRATIESVRAAQEKAKEVKVAAGDLSNAAQLDRYLRVQNELGGSLTQLLDRSVGYESLRSIEAFRDLQDQIEGTENRINVARRDYNQAVQRYNSRIRRFPVNIVAFLSGFGTRAPFEADPGAEHVPNINS